MNVLSSVGTWTPQGQFIQQLDEVRYHHHPQYTSSAPYHQPPAAAAAGEGRIISVGSGILEFCNEVGLEIMLISRHQDAGQNHDMKIGNAYL
jgi:hypothetical protein